MSHSVPVPCNYLRYSRLHILIQLRVSYLLKNYSEWDILGIVSSSVHLKTSNADACTQTLLYISYVHVFISITNYMDMLGTLEEYKPHDRDSIMLENTFYGAHMEQNIHCMKSLSPVFVIGA